MAFLPLPVTALTGATIDSTTAFPCSKGGARNDIVWSEIQATSPTWTGIPTFTPAARSSGVAPFFSINVPADTGQTAATEAPGILITGATRTHAAGTIANQRDLRITATTHAFASASTITSAATLAISGAPIAGTNATLTNTYAFQVESGQSSFLGTVNVGQSGTLGQLTVWTASNQGTIISGSTIRGQNSGGLQLGSANSTSADNALFLYMTAAGIVTFGGDTGFKRVAAKVAQVTDASTGIGFLVEDGVYRLTADVTNATATMANLTALAVTLVAGRKYVGELVVFASNSTAAEGLAFDFDGGTLTATSFAAGLLPATGVTFGVVYGTAIATDLTATLATTGDVCYVIKFEIVVNAGGTLIPRFSEVSHTTGTATARLGSYMLLKDCPT